MAKITNYGELKTEIANWAMRNNLTADIPGFIQMAEARIINTIPSPTLEEILTGTVTSGEIPIPAGYLETLDLKVDDKQLKKIPFQVMRGMKDEGGTARYYTERDGSIKVFPTPPDGTSYDLLCFKEFAALSADEDSNGLLLRFPDLYLAGSLKELSIFLKDPEQEAIYETRYQVAQASAERYQRRRKYTSGDLQIVCR